MIPIFFWIVAAMAKGGGTAREVDILPAGLDMWRIEPIIMASEAYAGLELLMDSPLPVPPTIGGMGEYTLSVREDSALTYIHASSPELFSTDGVVIHSKQKPAAGALLRAEVCWDEKERECLLRGPAHTWHFSSSSPIPEPWALMNCHALPPEKEKNAPLVLYTQGQGTIETSPRWQGLDSSTHPVAVVQMLVHSGLGTGVLSWDCSSLAGSGRMGFSLSPNGQWIQQIVPLYKDPRWSGEVTRLSLRPVDHPARVELDWIQLPRLAGFWAYLLRSSLGRWLFFALLTLILSAISRSVLTRTTADAVSVGLVGGAALLPVVLPFNELVPSLSCGPVVVPIYLLILMITAAMAHWGRRPSAVEMTAYCCILFTLAHGMVVAKGAGLATAVTLLCAPLAFLAGRGMARRGYGRGLSAIVIGGNALICVCAMRYHTAASDPLYGTLLSSIGRLYWDSTTAGRSAGAFVHPLVLATVAATLGSSLLVRPFRPMVLTILAVALFVISGFSTMSRSFVLITVLIGSTAFLQNRRRAVWAAAAVMILGLILVFTFRASRDQGLRRALHGDKRGAGFQVATATIRAKPIQGVGWGRYSRALDRFGPAHARLRSFTTPDNSYVRILTEAGIVGAMVWLVWLALLAVRLGRHKGVHGGIISPWIMLGALLFMAGIFDALYWPAAAVPCFLLLGCMGGEKLVRNAV